MRVLVVAFFFLPILALAQGKTIAPSALKSPRNSLPYFYTLYAQSGGQLAPKIDPLLQHIKKLEVKRNSFKTQKAFVHHVFVKTHQKFFTSFKEYSGFNEMLTVGTYNCLTATALYSLLLNHFDIQYKIVETNFHIFIVANTDKGSVLLETTDFENGFVDEPSLINKRIEKYSKQAIENTFNKTQYQYTFNLLDTVSETGVLGLLHFNHATKAFNEQNYKAAITHLHHAYLLHASKRMDEFASVLLLTITHSKKLNAEVKELYVNKVLALQKRKYSIG